jgi:hypothetical protein
MEFHGLRTGAGAVTRRPFNDLGSVILLTLLFLYYIWTATQGYFRFNAWIGTMEPPKQYSNRLADALLAGQLHLLVEPDPRLLALEDPYDPLQNYPYKLHDGLLYQGKYYLYWPLAPVVTFFIPLRLLGIYGTETAACVVFWFLGLFASVKLLQFLLVRCQLSPPAWIQWLMVLGLGACNIGPFLLRDPTTYQVSIAAGFCFMFGAAYFLCSGAWGEEPHRGRLLLGSLLYGLALNSRLDLIIAFPLVVLAYVHVCRRGQEAFSRDGMKTLAALFLPPAIALFLIGLYNYARFDSWVEFGVRYQLQNGYAKKWKVYDPHFLIYHTPCYLLQPYGIDSTFPYVHLERIPILSPPPGSDRLVPERLGGLFVCAPVLALLLLAPFAARASVRKQHPFLLLSVVYFMGTGLSLVGFFSFVLPIVTMRYLADFATFFLIPAFVLWALLDEQLATRRWRRFACRVVVVSALAYSVLVNMAIGISGYYDRFRLVNPDQYQLLEDGCETIRRLFVW